MQPLGQEWLQKKPVPGLDPLTSSYNTVRYNTTLLPSVSTTALGMFCGARYPHHTFTLIIKHEITTTANISLLGKRSFINKLCEKSKGHQAVHITYKTASYKLQPKEKSSYKNDLQCCKRYLICLLLMLCTLRWVAPR